MAKAQGKILFKLLGVVAGLVFVVFGFQERSQISRIKKLGHTAVVDPITTYQEYKNSGSSTYTAEFHFKTDKDQNIVQKHSFPQEHIADFKAGAPVRIYYLPDDPSTFVFEKDRADWTLIIVGVVGVVGALIFA